MRGDGGHPDDGGQDERVRLRAEAARRRARAVASAGGRRAQDAARRVGPGVRDAAGRVAPLARDAARQAGPRVRDAATRVRPRLTDGRRLPMGFPGLERLDPERRAAVGAAVHEVAQFVPDALRMLAGVARDPRVPPVAKAQAAGALAYVASPVDRLADWIPVLGQLDDIAVVAFAVHRLLDAAGEDVLREHWRGSERGFHLLLVTTGALATPRGKLRRVAVAGGVARTLWSGRRQPDAGPDLPGTGEDPPAGDRPAGGGPSRPDELPGGSGGRP